MIKKILTIIGAFSILLTTLPHATEPSHVDDTLLQQKLEKIDPLMDKALDLLQIPGIAVGVVVDGKVVFTKGYGTRNFMDTSPVNEDSLFAIGSCSKAFTTFALGQLVDEGILDWNDPVIKHIPEFRLQDIHATHHLTIKDLITHRSGLPGHDLVWYNSKFPRSEILNRIQHLQPTTDVREKFQYNNLMYAIAGLVIERVTGQTWEAFLQNRIFDPLNMHLSNFSTEETQKTSNFAFPHSERNEKTEVISFRNLSNIGPAGSINSSVSDMTKWIQAQLSEGELGGKHLINKTTLQDMHVVHMAIPTAYSDENSYLFGYGLGWMIGLHKGHYMVTHGGGIDGFISSVALFPKEKLGIVVLTNADSHAFFPSQAAYAIADLLLETENDEWLSQIVEKENHLKALVKEDAAFSESAPIHNLENYVGEFENAGYGTVQVARDQSGLVIIQNDIPYALKHHLYDHFTMTSHQNLMQKFNCSFVSNAVGEIAELHIAFEPLVSSIVFKRQIPSEFLTIPYLQKFVGTYESPIISMVIELKKDHLIATVPGQLTCMMKPEKSNVFSLKELPNGSLQFILEDETVKELQFCQAGQTIHFVPKAN